MSLDALARRVEATLDACRDTLARLEEAYSKAEDAGADPATLDRIQKLVVAYANLVAPLRDHLEQEKRGRHAPVRLAGAVDAIAQRLEALAPESGLHPTPEEAAELATLARTAQSK